MDADAQEYLHTTGCVFRPNGLSDANDKCPISLNKLWKGDATWLKRKTILRWDLDTE